MDQLETKPSDIRKQEVVPKALVIFLVVAIVLFLIFILMIFPPTVRAFIIVAILFIISLTFGLYTRYKILAFSGSCLIFLSLFAFPVTYSFLLKSNPNSMIVDDQVALSVHKNAELDVFTNYDPHALQLTILALNDLLNEQKDLNSPADNYLGDSKNLLLTKRGMIQFENLALFAEAFRTDVRVYTFDGISRAHISISNSDLDIERENTYPIKKLVVRTMNFLTKKLRNYNVESKIVKTSDVWTYDRILPLSINIFDTAVIKPVSPFSFYLVSFHKILLFLNGAALLTGFSMIFSKKNHRSTTAIDSDEPL